MKKFLLAAVCTTGTFCSFANVVIGDTAVTADVDVPAGETLEVRGSGLSAAGAFTVTLHADSSIAFYSDATIASKVTTDGAASLSTASGVNGTISGSLVVSNGDFNIHSAGRITFTGGGLVYGHFKLCSGEAVITNAVFTSKKYYGSSLQVLGGRMLVRDGGGWTCGAEYAHVAVCADTAGVPALLEIGTGGTVTSENNNSMVLAGFTAHQANTGVVGPAKAESKIFINGGTLNKGLDAIQISQYGVIELRDGYLRTNRRITVFGYNLDHRAKLILSGGTLHRNGNAYNADNVNGLVDGSGQIDVELTADTVLDFSSGPYGSFIFNKPGTINSWSVSNDAKLVIKANGADRRIAMSGLPAEGMTFDLNGQSTTIVAVNPPASMSVTLPADGKAGLLASNANNSAVTTALSLQPMFNREGHYTAIDTSKVSGFASVTLAGDLLVDGPDSSRIHLSDALAASVTGSILARSGNLILDTDPGNAAVPPGGTGRIWFQDTAPYRLWAIAYRPTVSKYWTEYESGWFRNADSIYNTNAVDKANAVDFFSGAVAYVNMGRDYKGPGGNDGGIEGDIDAYGFKVKANDVYTDAGGSKFLVGKGGLVFVNSKKWAILRTTEKERIRLTANQTWRNEAPTGTACFMTMGVSSGYWKSYLTATSAVTDWTIESDFQVWLSSVSNDFRSTTITVKEPARLRLVRSTDTRLNAAKLVLDGSEMDFNKQFPSGDVSGAMHTSLGVIDPSHVAPVIELRNGARLLAASEAVVSNGVTIRVTSGIGRLEGVFNLSDNTTVFDIAEGCWLDISEAEFTGGGLYTKTGAGALRDKGDVGTRFITDTERENEDYVLPAGKTLVVSGNGMKASSTITAGAGVKIRFEETATIAAQVTTTGNVTFETADETVEGTLAGFFRHAATGESSIYVRTPGLLNLIGGGDITNAYPKGQVGTRTYISVYGNLQITNAPFKAGARLDFFKGHMTVANGGAWNRSNDGSQGCHLNMDKTQTGDCIFEVGKGGSANFENNDSVSIGSDTTYLSKLYVNGGTFRRDNYDPFYMNYAGTGNGVIELANGGTIHMSRWIQVGQGGAKLILGDGTITGNPVRYGWGGYTNLVSRRSGGVLGVTFKGKTAIELDRFSSSIFALAPAGACTYAAEGDARLILKGTAGGARSFTVYDFDCAGLAFDLNDTPKAVNLKFDANIAGPLGFGWVLPGGDKAGVTALHASAPDVNVNYIVPDGVTFNTAAVPQWDVSLGTVSISNILFETGSQLSFPCFGAVPPALTVSGMVTVPDAMDYVVVPQGAAGPVSGYRVIIAAGGTAGGPCTFGCRGGVKAARAGLSATATGIEFTYLPAGIMLIVR